MRSTKGAEVSSTLDHSQDKDSQKADHQPTVFTTQDNLVKVHTAAVGSVDTCLWTTTYFLA